ncbi:uncharacterized protein LOC113389598 [Ctenocephalides felis]|uniref:uncharacterized protein LOC113389598 n=1 Tax=Ctenocephalides felis TaxID=7515 RepID=UPI000E6E4203|nr:uncharacterized protein LOC113389598 [Ctenocephalides felis]
MMNNNINLNRIELYDSHVRVQKLNQGLEDKLLRLVDRGAGERAQLTSDVATLSVRLAQANYTVTNLQREVERYKSDMSLAIQLIQCKPDNFVPQKLNSLPLDVQSKVAAYMRLDAESATPPGSSASSPRRPRSDYRMLPGGTPPRDNSPSPASGTGPNTCPFPPTAMVYGMRGYDTDGDSYTNEDISVSAAVVAKVLEDGIRDTKHHCETCRCATKDLNLLIEPLSQFSISTQTYAPFPEQNICVRCCSHVISKTDIQNIKNATNDISKMLKSNVSKLHEDLISFDNPVGLVGHHRLCDKLNKDDYKIDILDRRDRNGGADLLDVDGGAKSNGGDRKKSFGGSTGKTSQCSSKIFENFNRNLIQSIKSENPKAGPRLCSLRIQDGSPNVILNKSENNMAPVLYTRRKLDLENEVISSSKHQNPSNTKLTLRDLMEINRKLLAVGQNQEQEDKVRLFRNKLDDDKLGDQQEGVRQDPCGESSAGKTDKRTLGDYNGEGYSDRCLVYQDSNYNKSDQDTGKTFGHYDPNKYDDNLGQNNWTISGPAIYNTTNRDSGINLSDDVDTNNAEESINHPENFNNNQLDKLNSSTGDNTSQSLESSSMSSAEIRESAQLLRQQLHRVAEWVNANANMDNANCTDSDSGSHKNRSKASYKSHRMSLDSVDLYRNLDYNQRIRLHQANDDKDGTRNKVPEQENVCNGNISEEKEMTDLEQMEYNVKQFLLRQNEWSVCNSHM